MNVASIDLGTNSIKILIVRRDLEGHMHVLFAHRSVVRLGEGVFLDKGHGKIPRHVQVRTLKVFQNYAKLLNAYKVDVVRATGTSALRDAKNGSDFVREVRARTGIALEILPADEEARLIVKGVASEVKLPQKPVLFVDIGGGSCEISLVQNKKINRFASLPLGAVRLTELYLRRPKHDRNDLRRLDQHIKRVLRDHWPHPEKFTQSFGSAGTIRALARLIAKTELTDDDRLIKKRQLDRASSTISRMTYKRIAALPGIDSKRAEILVAGSRVLKSVFDHFHIEELRVSNRGLREGLLIDLFEHPQKPSGKSDHEKSSADMEHLFSIGRRYHSDRSHCLQVWRLGRLLFDELSPVHGLPQSLKHKLMVASVLHDVGKYVAESSSHKHTYYILKNTPFPFFNEKEVIFTAALARYHRKSPPRDTHEGFGDLNPDEKKMLRGLASLLRIADALDAKHDQGVRWIKCQWGPGKVRIGVRLKQGSSLNHGAIREKAKLFESLYKAKISVGLLPEIRTNKPRVYEGVRAR